MPPGSTLATGMVTTITCTFMLMIGTEAPRWLVKGEEDSVVMVVMVGSEEILSTYVCSYKNRKDLHACHPTLKYTGIISGSIICMSHLIYCFLHKAPMAFGKYPIQAEPSVFTFQWLIGKADNNNLHYAWCHNRVWSEDLASYLITDLVK